MGWERPVQVQHESTGALRCASLQVYPLRRRWSGMLLARVDGRPPRQDFEGKPVCHRIPQAVLATGTRDGRAERPLNTPVSGHT